MDAQRKLRKLLAYTSITDYTIEELEDCNKLYHELLDYINKQEKITELLGLYKEFKKLIEDKVYVRRPYDELQIEIDALEKELGEKK